MLKKFLVNAALLMCLAVVGLTILDPHGTLAQNIGGGGTINGNTITTGTGTLTLPAGKTVQFAGAFSHTGAYSTTLRTTSGTDITLPLSGTVATLAGSEALTNKTVNGHTITAGNGLLAMFSSANITFSATQAFGTPPSTYNTVSRVVPITDSYIIANYSPVMTLTLPSPVSYAGHFITLKTLLSDVVSNSSNVVPCNGGSAGISIVTTTAGKWAKMVADGSNWVIMECN